jgi:hypothetical protein
MTGQETVSNPIFISTAAQEGREHDPKMCRTCATALIRVESRAACPNPNCGGIHIVSALILTMLPARRGTIDEFGRFHPEPA